MGLYVIMPQVQVRTNLREINKSAITEQTSVQYIYTGTIYGYTYMWPYPLPEVAGEDEVTRERVGKSCVEFQHLEQSLSLDYMQVTVSQRPHIGTCMSKRGLFPKNITKHITLTCKK